MRQAMAVRYVGPAGEQFPTNNLKRSESRWA